jgi:ABC-type antimicrobial peptide transport system permease subunit
MTSTRLIFRSLRYHARSHLGALLGAVVGSTVLIGALVVGDSVRASLRHLALVRLGKVEVAMATGDRLFRAQLANDLLFAFGQSGAGGTRPAPALQLPAVATTADGSARANSVQVYGVDDRFWQMASQPPGFAAIPADGVVLNEPLAAQLNVKLGDTVLFRVQKPSALSRDAPLSPQDDATVALRLRVHAVIGDDQFGRFSLAANQVAPFNAFVALNVLQTRAAATHRANLLLLSPDPGPLRGPATMVVNAAGGRTVTTLITPASQKPLLEEATAELRGRWRLADAELELRPVPAADALELRTDRVFLDAPLADAVFDQRGGSNSVPRLLARLAPGTRVAGVLTYFVNELRVGNRATPYSMVTAIGSPVTPADLRDDEIIINQWLADDLGAKPGDRLTLKYFVVGAMRQLAERAASFRVRAVWPMNAPGVDRDLMPDFPGVTDAANCRDWDTGLPIDLGRIRPKDEQYWRDYRGTPKALISLAAGQRLWANRFGDLTAIRFYTPGSPDSFYGAIQGALTQGLDPAMFGLRFQPVRAQALAAAAQSEDFGQLFLGFSFFLIVAALVLLALLFQFSLEQRATEVGTLLALGFRPRRVRWLLLAESGAIALLGGVLGAFGGRGYALAMLHGLSTVWREAVGGVSLRCDVEPATLATGALIAALASWLAMWLALRKLVRRPAAVLLAAGATEDFKPPKAKSWWTRVLAAGSALAAVALTWFAWRQHGSAEAAGLFFGAGALLLVAGLTGCAVWLRSLAVTEAAAKLSLAGLGIRNATRRRRRSLAVIALLACGSFLIASIGVFHLDAVSNAQQRSSGTGGFALLGETAQPVTVDLDSTAGRDNFNLDTNALAGVSVVPFRVREGDDASCLNLNHPQQPRLLGVNPERLARRGAFTFTAVEPGAPAGNPWRLLEASTNLAPNEIPAIGDAASLQWSLGKQVGDTLPYTDDRGRTFRLRLVGAIAGSVLQGNLIIDENAFVARFPTTTGYRMFLIDAPPDHATRVSTELTHGLRDLGMEVTPTVRRLAAFNAVQNTYLGTFQVLGGLGLLLGSAGLGVMVLRNVLERRAELALLLALGLRRPALRRLVLAEHGALLLAGLGVGVTAALIAVLPTLLTPGMTVPFRSLALTLGAVFANGTLWTWLATGVALRGRLLEALRNE